MITLSGTLEFATPDGETFVVRPGDVLVVWKLDRLGRTLKQLIEVVATFNQQGIGFKSLKETIDTTTSTGKLVFHIFGALAEFERNLINERTMAGLEAARARGRKGGRPKRLLRRGLGRRQIKSLSTAQARVWQARQP